MTERAKAEYKRRVDRLARDVAGRLYLTNDPLSLLGISDIFISICTSVSKDAPAGRLRIGCGLLDIETLRGWLDELVRLCTYFTADAPRDVVRLIDHHHGEALAEWGPGGRAGAGH